MTNNRQFSKQLKRFSAISPDRDWVKSCKRELFYEFEEKTVKTGFNIVHSGVWPFLRRPAFLISSGVTVAMIVLALVFGLQVFQGQSVMKMAEYQDFRVSLRELSSNLQDVSAQLKEVDTAEKVLAVQGEVDATLEQGEQLLAQAKEQTKNLKIVNGEKQKGGMLGSGAQPNDIKERKAPIQDEVLAVLTDVEQALSQMKEVSQEAQKDVAERELENLRNSTLTEKQEVLLEQAEEYFVKGSYPQALAKIVEISQNR